jgi:hypothetical protein
MRRTLSRDSAAGRQGFSLNGLLFILAGIALAVNGIEWM